MTLAEHIKENWKLSLPIITGQVGQICTNIADNMMVGKAGSVLIASASLANGIFYFFLVVGMGFAYALTPLVAESFGENKLLKCSSYLKNSLLINLLLALLLSGILFLISYYLNHLGQEDKVVKFAKPYLISQSISILPLMFFLSFKQFLEGISNIKSAMIIMLFANVINIFLNWVLIYGELGFPRLGLTGAGIATLIARIFMAISIFIYFLWSKETLQYFIFFKSAKINSLQLLKLQKLGIPMGLQGSFEVAAFGGASIMAGWINEAALAAHQIALSLASISWSITVGLGSAITIRIGQALGQKSFEEVVHIYNSGYLMSTIFMLTMGLLFLQFGYEISGLYLNEPDIRTITTNLIFVAVLFQISDGGQVIGISSLRGLQDVKAPTLISFIAYCGFGIPTGYVLGFYFDLEIQGIWYGLFAGLTISAILLYLRLRYKNTHLNK